MREITITTTFQDVLDTVFDYAIKRTIMNQAYADVLKAKDANEHALADENKQLTPFGQELFNCIGISYQHRVACDLTDTYDDDYYDVYTLTFKD